MIPVFSSFVRALVSQLHLRMMLLTVLPFVVSLLLWGLVLWLSLQPLIDWLQAWFMAYDLFRSTGEMLGSLGLGALKAILVPLLAMWMMLPLMVLTALVLVGVIAMPAISRHVGSRFYAQLERRHGGSLGGSLWMPFSSFAVFLLVWVITLPLNFIPPFTFFVQPLLLGWLVYRVMTYDALADYADAQERQTILRANRWPLLAIGAVTGSLSAAPSLLWLGGVLSVIFFPLLAAVAIWLYVLVFVFTGLWFQHYCLESLARLRSEPLAKESAPEIIDLN